MNVAVYKIRTFFFSVHFLVLLTLVLTWKFGVSCFVADILGITALFFLGALYLSGLTYSYLSVVFQGIQTLFHIVGIIIQGRLLLLHIQSKKTIWLSSIFLWFVIISLFSLIGIFFLSFRFFRFFLSFFSSFFLFCFCIVLFHSFLKFFFIYINDPLSTSTCNMAYEIA